jgi:hypothetical protein
VEACPAEALTFGTRDELLDAAKARIYGEPEKYHHRVYGEEEAGGTGVLYLASVPFNQLGFRPDIEKTPYPELTREFLYGVPVVLLLWPAFLTALRNSVRKDQEVPNEN